MTWCSIRITILRQSVSIDHLAIKIHHLTNPEIYLSSGPKDEEKDENHAESDVMVLSPLQSDSKGRNDRRPIIVVLQNSCLLNREKL